VVLVDGDTLVAEAAAGALDEIPPPHVTAEQARDASTRFDGFVEHVFPECFVCGPRREPDDGLRIFAGPVAGRDGVVAATWRAREVTRAIVWAAIDCPGAFALGMRARGETLLGRMAARITRLPADDEQCVVVGWRLHEDGRKLYAGTALLDERGVTLAIGQQTWITPRPE
jgi:hypothetical protein